MMIKHRSILHLSRVFEYILFYLEEITMEQNSVLKILVSQNEAEYTISLIGRLDTLTSPDLEDKLEEVFDDAEKLIFDLSQLEYISSAGLRVLLGASQEMDERGEMVIRNLTEPVQDVFDVTGFSDAFDIE